MATKKDLQLYRGDSAAFRVQIWSDDGTTPYDLTGATVAVQFRDKYDGTEVVDWNTTVELPNVVLVVVTPAMWDISPAGGVWDLQVTDATGFVTTPVAGKVKVTLDVTQVP